MECNLRFDSGTESVIFLFSAIVFVLPVNLTFVQCSYDVTFLHNGDKGQW